MLTINEVFVGYLVITVILISVLAYFRKQNLIKSSELFQSSLFCILFFPIGWLLCVRVFIKIIKKTLQNKVYFIE